MEDKEFNETLELIVSALKERGYDPYWQIYGYIKEDEPTYITSHKGARTLIQKFSKEQLSEYLKLLKSLKRS